MNNGNGHAALANGTAVDRRALLDWLRPHCETDQLCLLYPKRSGELGPGWTTNAADSQRAIEAWQRGTLHRESFRSVKKNERPYQMIGASRLGLVPHRGGMVRVFCIDLDDHKGDGGNVHLLDALRRFFGADPIVFTSKGGKGLHCFFILAEPMPVADFIKWVKAWGFNREGAPELFPKTGKLTQAWLPNEPNEQGGDTYKGGTFDSCIVADLPAAPTRKLSSAALAFLRGECRESHRNIALNKAAFELGRRGIDRDEAWQLCEVGATVCGLLADEPDATATTFESGFDAGKQQGGASVKVKGDDDDNGNELNLWKPEGRTDTANSKRFVATFGRDIRYCPTFDKWLAWDDRRWRLDDVRRVEDLAKQIAPQVWSEVVEVARNGNDKAAEKLIAELTKWAKYTAGGKGIREMLGLARSAPEVVVLPAALDTHPMLLCCENGTIDLKTGNLRPHRREDYLTKYVPVKYDQNAPAPTWERFIYEVFDGNRELISFIQRAAGYTLTGDTSERCLFFLHGKGRNGKTTLVSALQKLLGDFAVTITIDLLTVNAVKSMPAEVVDLFGARMAVANETEDGSRLAESFLKAMTGGEDKQKGRRPYEQFVEFDATHKLWICGNHKPRIRGTDDGVWDRIRLVPFNVRFEKPDKQLPKKLAAEREGILRWCVEGALAWQRAGLGEPKAVADATAEYRTECDTLGAFLDACCLEGPQFKARSSDLYKTYQVWTAATGEFAVTHTKFGLAMSDRFKKEASNGVWYVGVGLREGVSEGLE